MNFDQKTLNTNALFKSRYEAECLRVHRFMTWLMIGQLVLGIAFAMLWSPFTWIGEHFQVHVHVWASVIIGGALSGFAIIWMHSFPRAAHTRHVVAVTQMLWSALLIHLSGGRIETHFHVFASLAILSIYRDWHILISATVVVAADPFVRGVYFPMSAFGIFTASPFRWMEHAAWVVFEIAFLVPGCRRLLNEIRELCVRQTEIEEARRTVDLQVAERTSELRQANDVLKQTRDEAEKLAMVARYTDNAVVIFDQSSIVEWVNDGFTRVSGYTLEEVVGKHCSIFQHGPDTIARLDDAIQRMEGVNTEIMYYRKSGEPYWLSVEVRPIRNCDGEVLRFMAIQSDITERVRMELSLADAEARLRSIMDNVPGAVYRRRAEDHRRVVFASHGTMDLTGYTAAQLTSEDTEVGFHSLVHEDDVESLSESVRRAVLNQTEYEHEYRIVDRTGAVKWVWEKGQYICVGEGERAEAFIDAMLFDISERVDAEKENERLHQELLDVSRQAGMAEMPTGVLHNVGNILNSVNVSASMIKRQMANSALKSLQKVSSLIEEHDDDLPDFIRNDDKGQKVPLFICKVTEALETERETVTEEFDDLLNNVEHIKEIVSVQQSMAKSSGLYQELSVNDLIRDALSANKASLSDHEICVEQQVGDSLDGFVLDKHRILQILINLIKNARDAMVEHQTADPQILIRAARDDASVILQVADNGIGIAGEKLDQIFQHGFTTKKTGHGFGLHSSANSATEIGGSLTVESDGPGTGATFTLRLPFQPATSRELLETVS